MKGVIRGWISALLIVLSPAMAAQGTAGEVTALNRERGLIAINGETYRLALRGSAEEVSLLLRRLRTGQIVNYELDGEGIGSLEILTQYKTMPH